MVGKFLMTFKDYPASQTAGSFNLTKMQKQIEEMGKGSQVTHRCTHAPAVASRRAQSFGELGLPI